MVFLSGSRFNIKMPSYRYRKSHCGDKTVVRSSYLHNGIFYTGKMTYFYCIRAKFVLNSPWIHWHSLWYRLLQYLCSNHEWYVHNRTVPNDIKQKETRTALWLYLSRDLLKTVVTPLWHTWVTAILRKTVIIKCKYPFLARPSAAHMPIGIAYPYACI